MISEINECDSDPCLNEATCNDSIADVICTCMSGYTGKFCESGKLFP